MDPPITYNKVARDFFNGNGLEEYTEALVLTLDIGFTDQLRFWTAKDLKKCITLPEIIEKLLRLHKFVLDFSPDVFEDEDAEAGMDFP